ncbi:MAG: peptidase, partial [Phycisphaerae bacterium]|nr:peptidase [Phycisphaerae bacterium]
MIMMLSRLPLLMITTVMIVAIAPAPARAASPDLRSILPAGGQRGAEIKINLYGFRLLKPQEIYFYGPGITAGKIEAQKGQKVTANIKIAPDAPLGEHKLRLRCADGWTEMRTFYVGTLPSVEEKSPNDQFTSPQPIPLNVTVHGVVKTEDQDFFVVEAKKGQRLSVEVEGIRLGKTMFDPYVAILDEKRFELAASDDTPLLRQDAFASVVVPADGKYVIQLRESAYAGSDACHYRLHVGNFPRPAVVYPLGGQPGESLTVTFLGDPAGPIEQQVKLPDQPEDRFGLWASDGERVAPSPNWVRVQPMANVLEQEPNNSRSKATRAPGPAPLAFNGI